MTTTSTTPTTPPFIIQVGTLNQQKKRSSSRKSSQARSSQARSSQARSSQARPSHTQLLSRAQEQHRDVQAENGKEQIASVSQHLVVFQLVISIVRLRRWLGWDGCDCRFNSGRMNLDGSIISYIVSFVCAETLMCEYQV